MENAFESYPFFINSLNKVNWIQIQNGKNETNNRYCTNKFLLSHKQFNNIAETYEVQYKFKDIKID